MCRNLAPLLAVMLAACGGNPEVVATNDQDADAADEEREPAPELEGGIAWMNTPNDAPLTLAQLRGHVVMLDFWTYGCVNCINMIPVYREIEEMFAGEPFVVIGVHAGNLPEEKDPANVRVAIEALEVTHPVVVDSNKEIWRAYEVPAWPTAVTITADGLIHQKRRGEFRIGAVESMIRRLIDEAKAAGIAASEPYAYRVDPTSEATTPLRFPTKILAMQDGRIAVTDSARHRVVISTNAGVLDLVIGTGERGWVDGPVSIAQLARPQGLAEHDGDLFVADTENHVIRRVDLAAMEVSTVAGLGYTGGFSYRIRDGWVVASEAELRTPWALHPISAGLAFTGAGNHQVLLLDPANDRLRVLSGTSAEGIADGPADMATFAQPSGLATSPDGQTLYVADPESSAVRAVSVADGSVTTLVGVGLREHGDIDGVGDAARLQHVTGLETLDDGTLLLADSFNSKIKRLDPSTREVRTLDWPSPDIGLDSPQGLTRAGSVVYVADTNNHRVLRQDLDTGETTEFVIDGLEAPGP